MVANRMWKRDIQTVVASRALAWDAASMVRERWIDWHNRSTNHKILATSAMLVVLTLVCKSAAAVREGVTADCFGAGDELDAMVVALALPVFAMMALGRAAGSALLPTFTQIRAEEGNESASRLLREATFWFLVLLLTASVLLAVSSRPLVDLACPGFSPAKRMLARDLLLVLTPIVLLSGVTSLWNSVLNSQQRFAATGIAPVLTPIAAIVSICFFGGIWGIRSLAIGVLLGTCAEAAVIGWLLHRSGQTLVPLVRFPTDPVAQVLRQYAPLVFAAALMSSTTLIDNAMASHLGSGGVATLGYSRKLIALAISLPALSVSRAVFPYFAQQVATHNWSAVRDTLGKSSWVIMMTMIPLTVLLFIFSRPLTSLLFQHGAFRPEDTAAVSWTQAMYALQIPFYTLGVLYVRLVSSMRLNHLLTISTVISVVLNITLNYVFMQRMGVAGIALSTSVVYAIACAFLALVANRAIGQRESQVEVPA